MAPADASPEQQRWERVQDLLGEALDLPVEERVGFLEKECGDDEGLLEEVASLAAAAEESDAYFGDLADRAGITLSTETGDAAAPRTDRGIEPVLDLLGQRVGQYQVLEWLGQGGMATVYLAQREGEGFTQRVALKVVSRRLSDPLIQRRSNEERRLLARLEHRSIARLIDGGVTPAGHPFYAMEYVEGRDLLEYCDAKKLSIKQRLQLFLEVCAPVQFAHERLIVHCDLKPSNIYVTDDGHVKLLDFGVARLIDPDAAGSGDTGLWFTPAYASPEQVRREPPGTHSDVYSLGVLLYEILTGHRPYQFGSRLHEEVSRTVGEVVPPLPSQVVTQPGSRSIEGRRTEVPAEDLASSRRTTTQAMKKRLRGDLDAIVMKALAKDQQDRYSTAEQLATDIRRHLSHRLVSSVPATPRYRAEKYLRRNKGAVTAATLVLLTLGAGVGTTLWQAARATDAAAEARDEAEKAQLVASLMADLFRLSDPNEALGDTITARDLLDRGTERIQVEFGDQPIVQADLLSEVASVYNNLGLFSRAKPLVEQALRLRTEQLGVASVEVSESLVQLGTLQGSLGEQRGAIETLSRAIDIREPLVAYPDDVLVEAQAALGWMVRADGQYERAAQLFAEALEAKRLIDPSAPGTADLMFGLAASFHDGGMLDQADSVFGVVIASLDETSRPTPTAVAALENVGMIRRLREQYREAVPLLRSAVDMSIRLYGVEHAVVLSTQNELGLALSGAGAWGEAEQLLRNAGRISEQVLGPLHMQTARIQESLGSVLDHQGQYEEAANLHQLALQEKIRRHENRDHAGVVASHVAVARSLALAGRHQEARDYITQAESMNARLGSDRSVYSISSEHTLGLIHTAEENFPVAEEHFLRAISLAEELLTRPDHRYLVSAKRDYGVMLSEAGRSEEAVLLLEEVERLLVQSVGEPHPLIDRTRRLLAAARTD
jgi:serine/threonine-protein kinase